MKVSRAELAARSQQRVTAARRARAASRGVELLCLVIGSTVVATGLCLVYLAKTHELAPQQAATLDLNDLTGPQQLIPLLGMIPAPTDQDFVASQIYNLKRHGEIFSNVGALGRMRVTETGISRAHGLVSFPKRLAEARERREQRESSYPQHESHA